MSQPGTFTKGDVVTWKGEDSDLPLGTTGRVSRVHANGEVEVAFSPHSWAEDKKLQYFTFVPDRLDLIEKAPDSLAERGRKSVLYLINSKNKETKNVISLSYFDVIFHEII
jgi:hypothetical protein